MQVAILRWNKVRDVLSVISFGIEFHVEAPSYMKLFFMLLVRGFGK